MKAITSPNRLYPNSLDSHCHLYHLKQKGLDIPQVLQQWYREGLCALMNIVLETDEQDWQWHLQMAQICKQDPESYPRLLLSVGVHPNDADGSSAPTSITHQNFERDVLDPALEFVAKRVESPEVWAIGETGLDYYHHGPNDYLQKKSLVAHIQLAQKLDKVLIIHNRESDTDLLEILSQYTLTAGAIMHCFSGNTQMIGPLLERGFYFSFAGNVTYKNAQDLRHAASLIPPERLLVETDAPFLAPQPVRGQINHPGFIGHTIDVLAQCQNIDIKQIWQNWQRLFPTGAES